MKGIEQPQRCGSQYNTISFILALFTSLLITGCAGPTKQIPTMASPPPACIPAGDPAALSAVLPGQPGVAQARSPAELPGWANHDFLKSYVEWRRQCPALMKTQDVARAGLRRLCAETEETFADSLAARAWFEAKFLAYAIEPTCNDQGQPQRLITGYFEPLFEGRLTPEPGYSTPLLAVPDDLVTVDLTAVQPATRNLRLRGRLAPAGAEGGQRLVPYHARETIYGSLVEQFKPRALAWLASPLEAFSLEIQGSGRIRLPDGRVFRLNYANQNGHPYVAIGRVLIERGVLTPEQTNWPAIKAWLEANPQDLQAVLNRNPSVVFFSRNELSPAQQQEGPRGSMGLSLAAMQAVAVDPQIIPLGALLWLQMPALTHMKVENQAESSFIQRLVLAQDTGGAIRGRVRADLFWGTGPEAERMAGITKQPGELWVLWPR